MILIGQYDSPFVRRVGITLMLYRIPFEHRPWSTFGDADKFRDLNPLTRVPTLVLDDGDVLVDCWAILDYVDSLAPAEKRLIAQAEPDRHKQMKVCALATGLSEKAISLFYERVLHQQISEAWEGRCLSQIAATLAVLEANRAARSTDYWFGSEISHADIAVAAGLRHMNEAHPGLIEWDDYPALKAHSKRLEALPVFQEISQPFIPPA